MKLKKKKSENALLARKYAVTERTIRNWRAEKAPISDPAKLSEWLASRKHCPRDTTPENAPAGTAAATDTTPLQTGAAAALKRLEQAEALAYQRLDRAIAAKDSIAIRVARESWLEICTSLRQFERSVSEDKRERGELVNRDDVEKWIVNLAGLLRIANVQNASQLAPLISGETDVPRLRTLLRRTGFQVAQVSESALRHWGVPAWIVEPFLVDLVAHVTVSREELDRYTEIIGQAMAALVPPTVADVPKS